MYYEEFPPHPALRAHVACMWLSMDAGAPGAGAHRVLPDNCVDILWQDTGRPAFAVGMMTRPIFVASAGPVRTVAVRFKPGAAGLFLGVPLHALTDEDVAISEFWGGCEADRLADGLWTDALDGRRRIALVERHLLRRLYGADLAATLWADGGAMLAAPRCASGERGGGTLIGAALAAIDRSGGGVRIETLADGLGVTRQHLAAQFRAKVGLTPKMYARVCRFRRATEALARPGAPDWAQLAFDCGYFDQSHLIHDFQQFSGGTPDSFLR